MFAPDLTAFFAPPPVPPVLVSELGIAERMAAVIRELRGPSPSPDCDGVTLDDFRAHPDTCDLSRAEIEAHRGAAARLLRTAPDPLAAWDSDTMLNRMVAIACIALGDEVAIWRALREAGYSNATIAAFWPRLMSRTADAVRTARLPQVV